MTQKKVVGILVTAVVAVAAVALLMRNDKAKALILNQDTAA